MRKRSPDVVIDQFQDELRVALSDWGILMAGHTGAVAGRASMDAFTRIAVAFERFRSDWHIAAITRDSSAFAASQQRRAEVALDEGKRECLKPYMTISIPKHPTLEQVEGLLDPAGGNLSISAMGAWEKLAKKHLADPWRARVTTIGQPVAAVADAVIAVRNAAAHQSARSLDTMNRRLDALTHPVEHACQGSAGTAQWRS